MRDSITRPPIDFASYIAEHARDFIGRKWVLEKINDWLSNPNGPRFFLLSGEPGSGKTAIASRLCQVSKNEVEQNVGNLLTPGFLSAFHFCSARDLHWINPRIFMQSLVWQFAERYPQYSKAILEQSGDGQVHLSIEQNVREVLEGHVVGLAINRLDVSGILPEDFFSQFVREPLEELFRNNRDHQVVILVDALDEALRYSGKMNIISLLSRVENLPAGIRFILTTRKDARVEDEFLDAEWLELSSEQFDRHNQEDIRRFVAERLTKDQKLVPTLTQVGVAPLTEEVEKITKKSAGNFQYVRFLLDDLARTQGSLTYLHGLPTGLNGLYRESLLRVVELGEQDWFKDYAPIMGVLSVAQESLTLNQLHTFTRQNTSALWSNLGDLQQFIEEVDAKGEEKRYRLYHQSIIDFLHQQSLIIDKKELRNRFYLSTDEWHAQIINSYRPDGISWMDMDWSRVDNYGLRYLAAHLYALKSRVVYRQDLYRLICKPLMEAKQAHFGSHLPFSEDIVLAIDAAQYEEPPNFVEEVRGSLLYATLGSLASSIVPEALAALAQTGHISKALGFAALMQDPKKQSETYCLIGNAMLLQKQLDEVPTVLNKALKAAEAIEDERGRATALSKIVQMLAEVGLFDQALAVAVVIEIEQDRVAALSKIVQELAEVGLFDQALKVAKTIEIEQVRDTALGKIIQVLAETREIEHPGNIVNQILAIAAEINQSSAIVFVEAVRFLIRGGQFEQALMVAESIEDRHAKATAQREIIQALVQAEKKEWAVTIAWQMLQELEILPPFEVASRLVSKRVELPLFTKIVQILMERKEFDQALVVVRKVWDDDDQTDIFDIVKEVLEDLMISGMKEQAISVQSLVY